MWHFSSQPKALVYLNRDREGINSLLQQEYKGKKKDYPLLSAIKQFESQIFITEKECSKFLYLPFWNLNTNLVALLQKLYFSEMLAKQQEEGRIQSW